MSMSKGLAGSMMGAALIDGLVLLAIGPDEHPLPPVLQVPARSFVVPVETDTGLSWASLTDRQRMALLPLGESWPAIDSAGRRRWINVAEILGGLSGQAKARAQARMAEWATLTPQVQAQTSVVRHK